MLVLVRGAGDLASGIAIRLFHCGMQVVMTEIEHPMAIRRTVSFCEAVIHRSQTVEDVTARLAEDVPEALELLKQHLIPVLVDPGMEMIGELQPDVLVDAVMARRNTGITINDAPVVIAIGPGFTAGVDCHAVIETMRGHTLGRVLYEGATPPSTGVPGMIGGYAEERLLRAPCDGTFHPVRDIGDHVHAGETVGYVDETPMISRIDGVLRGIMAEGVIVWKGKKAGDVDPRDAVEYCDTVSDKSLSVAGGVLEAILHLTGALNHGGN